MFNTEILKERRLILDGGTGTLLGAAGLSAGERPEIWNLTHPEEVGRLHRAYFDAGSDIVCTNTFGANALKHDGETLKRIIDAAVKIADTERKAAEKKYGGEKYIALDIGSLGKLLKPFGDLDFDDAVKIFSQSIRIGVDAGVDLIYFETFTDAYELKAAIVAAKESCDLPIFATCAYEKNGRLMMGADVKAVVAMCEGLGVSAMGANCGMGPDLMKNVVRDLNKYASVPIIVKPNAGLPKTVDGKTVYDLSVDSFAKDMREIAEIGASLVGGCCGTTPEYIAATVSAVTDVKYIPNEKKDLRIVSSYCQAVELDGNETIGMLSDGADTDEYETAVREGDVDYMIEQAMEQVDEEVDILGINVALDGTDETAMLKETVSELQSIVKIPFMIETENLSALESAVRIYNGNPLIRYKGTDEEKLHEIIKKYGGVIA